MGNVRIPIPKEKGESLASALGRGGVGNPGDTNMQKALARRESPLRPETGKDTLKGPLGR